MTPLPRPSRVTIGIVDDHPLFRLGVATTLRRDSSFAVRWGAATPAEARERLARHPVDVVLLDATLLELGDGFELMRRLVIDHPESRVIAMSADDALEAMALDAGAVAFFSKAAPVPEFVSIIRRVAAAGRRRPRDRAQPGGGVGSSRLTPREIQVLRQIQMGLTNREISENLGVSVTTVNKHVQSVLRKIGARNRSHAASLSAAPFDRAG